MKFQFPHFHERILSNLGIETMDEIEIVEAAN